MVGTHNRFAGVLSVDVDDLAVGREAADALSQVGFKSLTCLGNGTPYSNLRIQGFEDSVRKSELPFFTHTELGFEERRMRYSDCLLYTSPSPRDVEESRMPSSA